MNASVCACCRRTVLARPRPIALEAVRIKLSPISFSIPDPFRVKRSVVIQKQYLFKHPGPEDGPAQGFFPQLRGGASVDRRKDAHAAAEGLPDPG